VEGEMSLKWVNFGLKTPLKTQKGHTLSPIICLFEGKLPLKSQGELATDNKAGKQTS
jgi:hypothetical protein